MIAFIFAMKKEASSFLDKLNFTKADNSCHDIYFTTYNNEKLAAIISGVGKVNSAIAAQFLIDNYHPDLIINGGICGGLDKQMEVLDTYLCNGAVEYDFDLSRIDPVPAGKLEEYATPVIPFETPILNGYNYKIVASGDHFYDEDDEASTILDMGATLKDMESGAIAHTCNKNNQKLIIIKCLSDVRGKDAIRQYSENALLACEKLTNELITLLNKLQDDR